MDDEQANMNRVQDAELLYESIRDMKQLSKTATSVAELHAMLGHLATAGHLLPEVLTELGQILTNQGSDDAELHVDAETCQALLDEAADLAYRAGTVLRRAQLALEPHV